MDSDTDTIEPQIGETPPQTPPDTTANAKLRLLHTAIGKEYNLGSFDEFKQKIQDPDKRKKLYDAVGKEYNLGNYDDFQTKLGFGNKGQTTPIAPQAAPPQEHEIVHNPLQDIRHVQEMANQPVPTHVIDPQGGLTEEDPEAAKQNKAYKAQYDKLSADLGSQWGTKPEAVKQVLQDFPNEQDENKLKSHAALATENPVAYGRLKSADDIRVKIAQDGPNGIHDANIFNHLLDAQNYQQLTEENIPYQMQLMREHNLGQGDMDQLKEAQRSLINSTDIGLLQKYWNSKDKEYGLTPDEYAGLETERLFNPNKATMDEGILKHSRGIGEDGKANPLDMSKESYAYQRGVENIKYNLQNTGRENLAQFISEHKGENDKQIAALTDEYQKRINNVPSTQEQQQLIEEFKNHPVVQEANKLEDAQQGLQYSESEDQRRYPLNFSDQATRAVADAMDHTQGFGTNVLKLGGTVLQGAGETSDNTLRFIKNTAINLLGSDESRAFNNAVNIGHQSLTDLSAYEPTSYTGRESPLIVPRETMQSVQDIFNGSGSDAEKEQKAISYIRDNLDQLKVNPKSGQQNLTGKATLFQAANVMGQILGVANQSFLLGGAIGDASKLQQMATAFTPMYMSTQNQMYEQALKNGDEHPLLKSNIDATIISLASLINPDIKVVKGILGAETGVGKMLAGISEDTWNKVLTTNKPWLDKTIAVAKATGRQLGLANLQYGVIAPTAQYLAHKTVLNEDANLGDMIKDGVIQTSLSMALPALLHGVWAGKRATEVNPAQKYAIVEAGLHSEQQIDLVQSQIEKGIIPEIQGHEMKQIIKHAGEILQNSEMIKTDGTPMNEREVADTVYNMLRKEVLEKKMKTAAEPVKPIIEEKIHEINKDISDLHTSADDQHKNELNQLLHDNLDRIKDKAPEFEQTVKDAIAANNPEEAFKIISDKANETKKVEGVETSLRPEAEEIYGKPLVEKAIELSKQSKIENNGEKTNQANAGDEKTLLGQSKPEGAEASAGTAPSIKLVNEDGEFTHEAKKMADNWILNATPEEISQRADDVISRFRDAIEKYNGDGSYKKFLELKYKSDNSNFEDGLKYERQMKEMSDKIPDGEGEIKPEEYYDESEWKKIKQAVQYANPESLKGADLSTLHRMVGREITDPRTLDTKSHLPTNLIVLREAYAELKRRGFSDNDIIKESLLQRESEGHNIEHLTQLAKENIEKLKKDAIQEPSAGGVLQHPQEGIGSERGERGGMERGQQGEGTSQEGGGPQAEQSGGEVPPKEVDTNALPFGDSPVGIAHEAQADRAKADLNVLPPERGEGITLEESVRRGKELLDGGADPDKIVAQFLKDRKVSSDDMAVVRAHYNELAKKTNEAYSAFGERSPQADQAFANERTFYNNAVKPMQTEWSKIGVAQQGGVDLDTGSVMGLRRAFQELHGKDLNPAQAEQAKQLSDKVKFLDKEVERLKDKLDKAFKEKGETKEVNIKEKAQNLAKKIRDNAKLNRPGMFSAATPASLAWDGAVEIVAKSIEAGGALADAIAKGLEHIKGSDWYKQLSNKDKQTAETQFTDWHMDQGREKTQLAEQFVNKSAKDNKFTADEAKAIWDYLKTRYMDKETPFPDALKATANDLGLSMQQVIHAIATPKGAKEITDEMFKKQHERNKAINYAKRFVKTANQPAAVKFFNSLPSAFFNVKTYGHGTVGNITHGGSNIFRPSVWKAYWPNVLKSFKLAYGSISGYEKAITILESSPHFTDWKRAGLAVDPREAYDDFQVFGKKQSWLAGAGTRGFTGLKFMRYDMAEMWYNRLSDTEKADPNTREEIAKLANHATGHTEIKVPKPLQVITFAPGLEISRWQRMITDPAKAINTFTHWNKSTPAEQAAAKIVARGAGERLATYSALLAANAGLLSALNSKQQINLTNPAKSDWMRFKLEGKTIDFTGNILSPIRLLSVIGRGTYLTIFGDQKDLRTKPGDKDASTITQQARYKLSPLAGSIADVATGTDAMGNVLPWSHVKPSTGRIKMTWPDYAWNQMPIPIAAGYNSYMESMRERGVPHSTTNAWFNGALQFGVEGFTGVKMSPDYDLQKGGGTTGGGGAGGYYGK